MNAHDLEKQLADARQKVDDLESRMSHVEQGAPRWQPTGFYTDYYAITGFFLGMIASLTSLMLNVIGSSLAGLFPLQLIRVYLTFPLGEKALKMEGGVALAVGCCLYIGTGMLLGIVFQLVLARFAPQPGALLKRLVIASLLAIAVWVVSFYGILSWLQPLLFQGNWIVESIPVPVAVLTHLVFGWTMAVVFSLGIYKPYPKGTE